MLGKCSLLPFILVLLLKVKLGFGLWDGCVKVVVVAAGRYRKRKNPKLIIASF